MEICLTAADTLHDPGPDAPLVAAMARGDGDALARLYDRWASSVFGLALRITRQKSDAEHVVASTFAEAWHDAGRHRADAMSVGAWLAAIARRNALELVRSGDVRRTAETPAATHVVADDGSGATARLEDGESARRVRDALDVLPAAQRTALELAYFGGLDHHEIASRLSEPVDTVRTRIRLGMRRLRELLAPLGPLGAT